MDNDKDKKFQKDIEKILSPEIKKKNLILASLISTAFELMKYVLIKKTYLQFGILEFDSDFKPVKVKNSKGLSEEFVNWLQEIKEKLPKEERRDELKVILHWFKDNRVFTDKDIENVIRIRDYRNKITHELINFLFDSAYEVNIKYLYEVKEIIEKADLWWIKEFEIPGDPQWDNIKVDDKDIKPGSLFFYDIFISIANDLEHKEWKDVSEIIH